jgi:hypothetical protein
MRSTILHFNKLYQLILVMVAALSLEARLYLRQINRENKGEGQLESLHTKIGFPSLVLTGTYYPNFGTFDF